MALGWFATTVLGLVVVAAVSFLVLRRRISTAPMLPFDSSTAMAARCMAGRILVPMVVGGLTAIVILGGLGAWDRLVRSRVGGFDLDLESSAASALSALLLLIAAGAALLVTVSRLQGGRRWPWATATAGLAVLAVDERRAVHEQLEASLGTDWQVLYLPVFLSGGALGAALLRQLRAPRTRRLFLGAVALWCASQLLEMVQWDGDRVVDGYHRLMVIEELAEMTGSLLLAAALVDHARRPHVRLREGTLSSSRQSGSQLPPS